MTTSCVPTKAALLCDIKGDLNEIAFDVKAIGCLTYDATHDCNPCQVKSDLQEIACLVKDEIKTSFDLACDEQQLACLYHCSYSG